MPRYEVRIPYCLWMTVKVEADDQEAAIDAAFDVDYPSHYCGNGGTGDKLVGVSDRDASVEVCDEPLDITHPGHNITIEVNELP